MADLTISVDIDARGTKNGAEQAKRAVKSIGDEAQNTARNTQSLARVDFSGAIAKLREYGSQIQSVGQRLMGFGQQLTVGLTLPIAAVTTLGLKFNATKEQALVSFGVLLKNGEKAKQLFSELSKFSADTPFEMPEIQTAAKSLLAFGVAQEQVLPTLTRIGDIASGINVPMTELAEIYGKAKTQGRLFAEDINQLTGRGIPIIQELAKQFGVSEDKVKGLVESGKIGFPQLEKAFADMTGEGGQFSGMMAAQSKTFSGLMSTLADAANTTLGQLTEPLFNFISQNLPAIIGVLAQLGDTFNNLSPTIKTIILGIVGFAAALGPVLVVIGTIITIIGSFVGAIASIASGIAAIGGLSVALPLIAAIVAAIGLLVIGIGAAVGVVYGLVDAWQNGFGPVASYVALVVGGIITAFSPILGLPILIGAVLATIYGIWTTNFGGIRDVVATAVNEISTLINNFIAQISPYIVDGIRFMQQKFAEYWNKFAPVVADSSNQIRTFLFETWTEISRFLQENLAGITEYFRENWDSIREAIGRVMDAVVLVIRIGIAQIRGFWADHGEQIREIAGSVWNIVKTIVTSAITQIGNIIKLITRVINGDWAGAWQALKDIVRTAVSGLASILGSLLNIVWQILKGIVTRIVSAGRDMVTSAITIGREIVSGMANAISNGVTFVANAISDLAQTAINKAKSVLGIQSPSREFMKLGKNVVEGFIDGINSLKASAQSEMASLLDVSGLTINFGKDDIEGVNLLASLTGELAKLNIKTKEQEVLLELTAAKYSKLNQEVRNRIILAAQELDRQKELTAIADKTKQMLDGFDNALNGIGAETTELAKIQNFLQFDELGKKVDAATGELLQYKAGLVDAANAAKRLKDAQDSITGNGFNERADIQTQIESYATNVNSGKFEQITDEVDLEQIKRAAEWAKFAHDNKQKFTAEELESLQKLKEAEDELYYAQLRQLQGVKNRAATDKSYFDLLSDINGKSAEYKDTLDVLNGITTEANLLSDETRVRRLLETEAYKNLTAEQRENLVVKAQEIDASRRQIEEAQKAKQEFEAIAGEISGSLTRIFQAGIKDGFKGFLRQMLDELKNFGLKLLDNVMKKLSDSLANWLTGKLFGGGSSSGGGGFGGIFDSIKKLFGGGGSSSSGGSSSGGGIFSSIKTLFGFGRGSSSVGSTALGTHESAHAAQSGGGKFGLAGGLALAGMGANIVGGLIGGRVGGVISGAGSGLAMGAQIGSLFGPGPGTAIGAAIGAIAGGLMGLLGGDPKRKIDKKENMPKLTQGFADALKALRELAADKNALYNNPGEVLAKAMEIKSSIASGFGIQFQSGHYRKIAKQQIDAKLLEAEAIIKQIQGMGDEARQALETDKRLETSFARGVYMSPSFLRQFGQFKRRNGMLGGNFNGIDTLPSMLAQGEMVLNPYQINAVRRNAGFDVFQGAGIPNYAGGTYIQPPSFAPSASTTSPGASSPQISFQPNITIVVEGEGITTAQIKGVFVDSLESTDVQVKISKAADKGKSIRR